MGEVKHFHSQIYYILYMDARGGKAERETMEMGIYPLVERLQGAMGQIPSATQRWCDDTSL